MEVLKGMGNIVCERERKMALDCFKALSEGNLTDLANEHFDTKTADVYFNTGSGNVFLSDEDLNTVMLNDDGVLDLWVFLSYHGEEGFLPDLLEDLKNGNIAEEDHEELYNWLNEDQKEEYKQYFKHEIKE